MKANRIRKALSKYIIGDTIILEVLGGEVNSKKGGVWLEISVPDFERITERENFDPEKTGYKKYFEKWFAEGLITEKERETGK